VAFVALTLLHVAACGGRPDNEVEPTASVAAALASAAGADAGAACSPGGLSSTVTTVTTSPYAAQTTAVYDVAVLNGDAGNCNPRILLFEAGDAPPGFSTFVDPPAGLAPPGVVQHFFVSVTSSTDASPGDYRVAVTVLDATNGVSVGADLDYPLAPSEGCFVRPSRELFISDLSVVEDPVRTTFQGTGSDPRSAAWTFGRLMQDAAPTQKDAPAFVESLFDSWRVDHVVNGFRVAGRPDIGPFLLDAWPRGADGHLDLTRAPLRLLAIVDRIDLRSLANGHAGQGRFVFGVLDPAGQSSFFTVIVEYRLPAASERDAVEWARTWHALGSLPFPSEAFNEHLQRITDRFASRGVDPRGTNGSTLATVRTNEFVLGGPWELREFRLAPSDGLLHLVPVDATPDLGLLGTETLADFINLRERGILAGTAVTPLRFEGAPFLGGSAINLAEPWSAPAIRNPAARRAFSQGTCSGCHSIPETGTEFLQLRPRDAGSASRLSAFLLGAAVPDPVDGQLEILNDLLRRKTDLESLACHCRDEHCREAWEDLHRLH
jgi:hypothetical protein